MVLMDADGQNDPAEIPRLLEGLEGYDMCCGYRADRKDTIFKKIGSRIANRVRNRVLGEDIVDTEGRAVVLDLGLAKVASRPEMALTRTGATIMTKSR